MGVAGDDGFSFLCVRVSGSGLSLDVAGDDDFICGLCVSIFGCIAQTRRGSVESPWSKRSKVQKCQGIMGGCATLFRRNHGLALSHSTLVCLFKGSLDLILM